MLSFSSFPAGLRAACLFLLLGGAAVGAEREPTEIAGLTAALERAPESISLLSERGDAYLFAGRFREAVADFEKTIALDPKQDAPHWRLGIAYYLAGEWAKSSRQFAKYHAYDGHDRENGVWKFFSDAQADGLPAARQAMLRYEAFDREPFPTLYKVLAGEMTIEAFYADLEKRGVTSRPGAMFFADYYCGVLEALTGDVEKGSRRVRQGLERLGPAHAGGDYMLQVARVHLRQLEAKQK